ncbi:MAG: HlyC/CorC family transporter [Anaerolineales bacterium]|nr:HlyC/CorC family transporter [Anaerolineales bacterium]
MLNFVLITTAIVVLIFFNALYVAAEFATVASRKTLISQLAGDGNPMAKLLLPIMENSRSLDRYVAACQIGITISSLVLGAYGQNVLASLLVPPLEVVAGRIGVISGEALATFIILFFITTLQVVLGELLPKSIAIQYPERMALLLTIPMRASLAFFAPLIWLFNGSGNILLRLLGQEHHEGHGHVHSKQEIMILVTESHEGGLLDDEERQMLRNAFHLRDLTARLVMKHRTQIIAAPAASTLDELLQLSTETGKSRIPLYEEDIDNIVGFVHVKDVFRLKIKGQDNLNEIMRSVVHVPESLPASAVWSTLKTESQYMAIVFDEFGGTAGLITLEDLIEEIFGELLDESDNERQIMYIGKHGRRRLRGDQLVADVNEYFELSLPEDAADTLGGLVLSQLGHPAKLGDQVTIKEVTIRVEEMDDLTITEVSIDSPLLAETNFQVHEWEVPSEE